MIRHVLSTLAVAALLSSAPAFGTIVTSTWNGGAGNWSTAADWTPAAVPNNGGGKTYDVTVVSGAPSGDSVLLDTSPMIDSLTLGRGFFPTTSQLYTSGSSPQTLTITGPLIINETGTLSLNSSRLLVGGNATNAGYFDVYGTNSTASVSGNLTNAGTVIVGDLVGDRPTSGVLHVAGALINEAHSPLFIYGTANLGSLVNYGAIDLEGTVNLSNGITDITSGSVLHVFGTLDSGRGSALAGLTSIEGFLGLENGQTVTITPGGGTLTDSGSLTLGGASNGAPTKVLVNGTLALRGTLTVDSGATLTLPNAITDIPQNTSLYLGGTILAGTNNALAGLTSIESGSTFYFFRGQSITIAPGGGRLTNAGSLIMWLANTMTVSGDLQNAGTVDVGSGNTVGTLNVTGTLTNQSSLLVSATANLGTLANSGNTTISGRLNAGHIVNDSSLVIASGGIVNARNVINNSSLILNIGGAVDSTTFTNARGGTLTLYGFSPSGSPGSQPGGVLNTMVFTSSGATLLGFPAAPGIGAIIAIGSGSVPGGTIGYYQFGNGTLAELIYGTPGGNDTCTGSKDCGIIEVASPVHLDGRLDPILANGFDPTDGESFIFLTAGSLAGRFSSMENMEFNNDTQYWVVSYGSDYVKLTAEPVPEPATLLLFGAGLAALGTAAWFERRNKHSR